MEALKACSVCNREADTKKDVFDRDVVRCVNINCAMHRFWWDVDDWNSRPIEDALQSKIVALMDLVAAQKRCIAPFNEHSFNKAWEDRIESRAKCRASGLEV